MPEIKEAQHFMKSIEDRTVVGLPVIHGNIDDGGDRSWPGSFSDIKVNGRDRARFLWQHNSNEPPIAAINYVREIPRSELPDTVLKFAPDATGAVEISRTYLDTPRGNEILAGLKAGALEEMSYAYEIPPGGSDVEEGDGMTVRNIRKVRIFDFSDVNHGMNPATVAVKSTDWTSRPVKEHSEAIAEIANAYIARIRALVSEREKAGRILSESNRTFIKGVADQLESTEVSLADVRKALRDLLLATEPEKALTPTNDEARRLWLNYQYTLAQLNGVPLL
jgi:ribosome recycling factor